MRESKTSPTKSPSSRNQLLPNSTIMPTGNPAFRLQELERVARGIPKHLQIQRARARAQPISSSLLHLLPAQESIVNQDIAVQITCQQDTMQQVQRQLLMDKARHKSEEAIIIPSASLIWSLKRKVILELDRWVTLHLIVPISELRLTLEVRAR